jgi:hypothetical protein
LKDARDIARKAHVRVANGEDPAAEKRVTKAAVRTPDRELIERVSAQFLTRHVKTLAPATVREVERILAREIIPAFRGQRLSEIKNISGGHRDW